MHVPPPKPLSSNIPKSEQGFVLISTIWLLMLGAAIVAAITLIVVNRAQTLSFEHAQLTRRLAIESAYETAVADILFNGPRSKFANLPTTADYDLSGVKMKVTVQAESGKLDVNQTDLALMDRALRGLGIASTPRNAFLGRLVIDRAAGRNIGSGPELYAALSDAGILNQSPAFCPDHLLTLFSGLPRPSNGQMPPELASAIGDVQVAERVAPKPGDALRMTISAGGGAPLVAVVRITGRLDNPVAVLEWKHVGDCASEMIE